MTVEYDYLVSDFGTNGVAPDRFTQEIEDDVVITTPFEGMVVHDDDVKLFFESGLSTDEESEIDVLIANHSGIPLPHGRRYFLEKSAGNSSTTDTNYQNKVTLEETDLPIGDYRVSWSYRWYVNNTSHAFKARLRVNESSNVMEHIQKINDTGERGRSSGFAFQLNITSGSIKLELDWCTSNAAATATIGGAYLEFQRYCGYQTP